MVVGREADVVIVIVIIISDRGLRIACIISAAHLLLKSEIGGYQQRRVVFVLCIQKAFAVARLVKILHQLRLGDLLRLRGGFAFGDAAVARFVGDSVQKRCAVVGDRFPRMNGGVDEAVAVRALIDRDFQHRPPRITVVIIHGDGVFPAFQLCAAGIDRQ